MSKREHSQRVEIKLTPEQKAGLKRAKKRSGKSRGNLIRKAVRRFIRATQESSEWKTMLGFAVALSLLLGFCVDEDGDGFPDIYQFWSHLIDPQETLQ